jgi:hypothetical protein
MSVEVFTFTAQAYAADPLPRPQVVARTGIEDLDALLGGIRAGDVWVITGPPRSGRSMLAVQLTCALAAAGSSVRYFLGGDSIQETVARFSAHTRSARLRETRDAPPTPDEPWAAWALDFVPRPHAHHTNSWDVLPGPGDCAVVVDDLDLWRGDPTDFLELGRAQARQGKSAVILTIPEHLLSRDNPATWQRWVRGADVIVELEPYPDGDMVIKVLSHRAGPTIAIGVYANFERVQIETPTPGKRVLPPTRPATDGPE